MKKIGSLVLFLSLLVSCSEYSKVVKSDNYSRKFELANDLFSRKSYLKASTLFEQVYQRVPKTPEGEFSYYRLGISYFKMQDYYLGAYYLASFGDKYPYSERREETSFLNVICAVKNAPKYSLDQEDTEVALNELQLFIYKFPESKYIDTCNFMMDKLREKKELKEFETVQLYDKTEQYKASIMVAQTFIKDFPQSIYKEEVYTILVKNSYLLAFNSIEEKKTERIDQTIERYSKFALEFPNSPYLPKLYERIKELKD
jgi:outer membrane protein assembly factor BamD